MNGHRLVLKWDDGPYVSAVECDWGTNPSRPCACVTCPQCFETSCSTCLDDGHDGAHIVEGCGVQDWLEACGAEGIRVEHLRVHVPCEVSWNGDGWTLTCKEDSHVCDVPSGAGGEEHE